MAHAIGLGTDACRLAPDAFSLPPLPFPVRIIAGDFRRRTLISPRGLTTRPIPDRVKESFYGMLGTRIKDAAVVDLFAGSGSIGLEALSRGAKSCLFVERDRGSADVLTQNIEMFKCQDRAKVAIGDALGLSIVARCPRPLDLVFFDPPYPMIRDQQGWDRVKAQASQLAALLADDGFLVIRTPWPFWHIVEEQTPVETLTKSGKRKVWKTSKREKRGDVLKEIDQGRVDSRGSPLARRSETKAGRLRDDRRGAHRDDAHDDDGPMGEADIESDDQAMDGVKVHGENVPPNHIAVDFNIAGARGPEMHRYGTTAIHWYMKAKS